MDRLFLLFTLFPALAYTVGVTDSRPSQIKMGVSFYVLLQSFVLPLPVLLRMW